MRIGIPEKVARIPVNYARSLAPARVCDFMLGSASKEIAG
jgi:hypothetical protein